MKIIVIRNTIQNIKFTNVYIIVNSIKSKETSGKLAI